LIALFCVPGTVYTNAPNTATLLGMRRRHLEFTPLVDLREETDFE